ALAVGIAQQRDVRGAIRIVLDPLDPGRNAFLVTLEVDNPVVLLVTAAAMPGRDATGVVAATALRLRLHQGRVRRALVQFVADDAYLGTAAGRRRLVLDQCHGSSTSRR